MLEKYIKENFLNIYKEDPVKYGEMLSIYYNKECTIENTLSPKISIKPYFQQLFDLAPHSIADDLIAARMWQMILHEELKYRIQETPKCFADKEKEKNDQLVKSYMTNVKPMDNSTNFAKVIEANFWGGTQGSDGYIKFDKPFIEKQIYFPLEIGYCKASQFYCNLITFSSIARLPYESNYIIYFELDNPDYFSLI